MLKLISTNTQKLPLVFIKSFKKLNLFYDSREQCFRLMSKNNIEIPELTSGERIDKYTDFVNKNLIFCRLLNTKGSHARKRPIIGPLSKYSFKWIHQLPDCLFEKPSKKYIMWTQYNVEEGILSALIQIQSKANIIYDLLESKNSDNIYDNFKQEIESGTLSDNTYHPHFQRFIHYFATHRKENFAQDIFVPEFIKNRQGEKNCLDALKKALNVEIYRDICFKTSQQTNEIIKQKAQKKHREEEAEKLTLQMNLIKRRMTRGK